MRDLLFKNRLSGDGKRKVISSSEISDKEGVHSVIRRHFICMVKEVTEENFTKPQPYLYARKEQDTKQKRQKFFCKVKGSVCALHNEKLFLVTFMHSLKIELTAIPQNVSL